MGKRITSEDIPKLSHNIRAAYRLLHPEGLDEATLERKAREHNFYRIILQHYRKEKEGQ